MPELWFSLGLLLVAGVVGRRLLSRRREVRAIRELAARRRLNFTSEDLIDVGQRYQRLDLIRRGHSRHACNLLYGTCDAGLVTLFCYTYDLGFGVYRVTQQWWIAVVEVADVLPAWRTGPRGTDGPAVREIGGRRVHADHRATLDRLAEADVDRLFQAAPDDLHWETAGRLVAVGTPLKPELPMLGQLLTSACDLAHALTRAASRTAEM